MALDLTLVSNDLDYIIADIPHTVIISGTTYNCTKTMLNRENLYSEYGLGDEYSFTIILNKNNIITTEPENGDIITFSGNSYRILRKEIDRANIKIILHVGSKYGDI